MTKICKTTDIRQIFLDYFKHQGHKVISSSSLIPSDDPTLFFTNAGMVQFKDIFLGKEKNKYPRVATVQRCLRASGKHNDLENVGYTNRHHTFFEMLGNFSFGDYFKREAIHYAWQFLTQELGIDPQKLWVTVHEKDQEAEQLWREELKKSNTTPQGLSHLGDKDNFWSMGEIGPCGYCSEIYYDHGEKLPGDIPGGKNEGDRYVEIWNLVFMEFERDTYGNLTKLPKPSIDTGMGLERIAAAIQGVHDNYATDIFVELHNKFIEALQTKFNISPQILNSEEARITSRVIADHIRASVFLIADGVLPSNEKAGYVLRSIIRRAVYYLYRLEVKKPFFFQLVKPLVNILGDATNKTAQIESLLRQEEVKFLDTLDRGLKILENELLQLKGNTIPGEVAFNLHDTYGFPIILTTEIAKKRGINVDQTGFAAEMAKQQAISRSANKFEMSTNLKIEVDIKTTEFVGYTQSKCATRICGLFKKDGTLINGITEGKEGIVILEKTPFYAESGGQVGDSGEIYTNTSTFVVQNTQKCGSLHLHYGYLKKGTLNSHEEVTAEIDETRRQMIRLNHSAAHLLHHGLHLVIGEHAIQRGSYVDNQRLRFDFTHFSALIKDELNKIEKLVNTQIRATLEVKTTIQSLAEAKRDGAWAIFGEKYGEKVRVVTMGGFSKELCGGTHINNTGEIGLFKITSETGIAAGIRRIEVVTGENALVWINKIESELKKSAQLLGVNLDRVTDKIVKIQEENHSQGKEILRLQSELMNRKSKDLAKLAMNIKGVSVLSTKLYNVKSNVLRQMIDSLRQQLHSAVVVIAIVNNDKIKVVAGITQDLLGRVKANELLQHITKQIDGGGGGRADYAEGGGTNIASLQVALESVLPWVKNKL
ncbi:MAG: alanine--tRNA ligase [Coxiellaceae bacterium]|jgi:alanyl-tRNA synthetase|nr:alanine--tRNA ligase [Coxiellaceae bacterium]